MEDRKIPSGWSSPPFIPFVEEEHASDEVISLEEHVGLQEKAAALRERLYKEMARREREINQTEKKLSRMDRDYENLKAQVTSILLPRVA